MKISSLQQTKVRLKDTIFDNDIAFILLALNVRVLIRESNNI